MKLQIIRMDGMVVPGDLPHVVYWEGRPIYVRDEMRFEQFTTFAEDTWAGMVRAVPDETMVDITMRVRAHPDRNEMGTYQVLDGNPATHYIDALRTLAEDRPEALHALNVLEGVFSRG